MKTPRIDKRILLGIEGGGTRTTVVAATEDGQELDTIELGPANLRLLSDEQLEQRLEHIRRQAVTPSAVAIGLAGVRTGEDRGRLERLAARIWPGIPCHVTNDLETALLAVGPMRKSVARVLLVSGTGSCCYGVSPTGETARVGGWGHQLGDRGSGYQIALQAIRLILRQYDHTSKWPRMGRRILQALLMNHPEELIRWIQDADKSEVARLAMEVFAAARERDPLAREVLEQAVNSLSVDTLACAKKIIKKNRPVEFVFAGSILVHQVGFSRQIASRLKKHRAIQRIIYLRKSGAWGAVELARQLLDEESCEGLPKRVTDSRIRRGENLLPHAPPGESPTEQRNPASLNLDRLTTRDAVNLMLKEDLGLPEAIRGEANKIVWVIHRTVQAFKCSGRLIYVGAGTSGRLGVLDASECPPTFRTPPNQVQGIIAGGQHALWAAIEGAEDDPQAGQEAICFRQINPADIVMGIAASGRTPFVWGALAEARQRGATTVLLCFNPKLKFARGQKPDCVIAPAIGPEILTGSTRLKAGTATKMILNMVTTLAMVTSGKVISNLMIDLNPSNEKLRDRAIRILQELTGASPAQAMSALSKSNWVVKEAFDRLR